jgi:LysM repeat protein
VVIYSQVAVQPGTAQVPAAAASSAVAQSPSYSPVAVQPGAAQAPAIAAAAAQSNPMVAAPPLSSSCASDYVVQAGDQLDKIAQQFLGTLRSVPNIVTATNAAAATNSAYHQVTDPSLLGVGWRLCIPPASQ